MKFGRQRHEPTAETEPLEEPAVDPRANGPWDATEKDVGGDPDYLDLGALLIRGRPEFNLQLPADDAQGTITSVVLVTQESGLELRAFASARSGGLWDTVRTDLVAEVERMEGTSTSVAGPYGPELHFRIPATVDGEEGFQPSRVLGIEGPRWMVRAVFFGREALEPSDDGLLMQALRDVVVVRGDDPRAPGEPLPIVVGEDLELVETPRNPPPDAQA